MRTEVHNDKTVKKMTKNQISKTVCKDSNTLIKNSRTEKHTNQQIEEEQPKFWWQKGQYA